MPTISRFEDIEAWCEARALAVAIYSIASKGSFARDYGLRDQIQRASVSVMSNIAEGFERGGKVEFRRFLAIARGSVGEVKSPLYLARDVNLIDQGAFSELYGRADSVGKLIGGLMRYLATTSHS